MPVPHWDTDYRCIVADPPWAFHDALPGEGRGARKHYKTLTVAQMEHLQPYREIASGPKNAVLFLWRVASMQPEALQLAQRWGFTVKSELVWEKTTRRIERQTREQLLKRYEASADKRERAALRRAVELFLAPRTDHFGMGRYVRMSHEVCLIATRGKVAVKSRSIRSRFRAPVGRHSEKPGEFYDLVEQLVPGPYYELFARAPRAGWVCLGDEL